MSDSLVFNMGEFEALFPIDRYYAKNHMWAQSVGQHWRFGFTAYAVRLLQDVYFLDWMIDAPAALTSGAEIGSIESKKAESSLYAPATGELTTFNDGLMDDPTAINTSKYDDGWLFEMKCDGEEMLSPEAYLELLVGVWDKTQRTIKGQLH